MGGIGRGIFRIEINVFKFSVMQHDNEHDLTANPAVVFSTGEKYVSVTYYFLNYLFCIKY